MRRSPLVIGPDAGEGEFYVPVARLLHVVQPGTTLKDIEDLPYRLGGRAATPNAPLVIRGADGVATLIPGFGVTEAAELQELAQAAVEKHKARIARNGGRIISDEFRERHGYVSHAQYDAAFREALVERVRQHQANPVTDPARTPGYSGKRLF